MRDTSNDIWNDNDGEEDEAPRRGSRLRRFGITESSLAARCLAGNTAWSAAFSRRLARLDRDAFLVAAVSLYVHLMDQGRTGMLTGQEAGDWANHLLSEIGQHYACPLPIMGDMPLPERLERYLSDLLAASLQEQERLYPEEPPI